MSAFNVADRYASLEVVIARFQIMLWRQGLFDWHTNHLLLNNTVAVWSDIDGSNSVISSA